MNKKYYLLILILGFSFANNSDHDAKKGIKKIEEEKDIPNEKIYDIINRDLELYNYNVSFGHSIPLGSNLSNSFDSGGSLSLIIDTPYKSAELLNRFTFKISSEIIIKNYKYKSTSSYKSNYNIFGFYMLLNQISENNSFLTYGIGMSHINQGTNNSLVPSFKLIIDYKVNFVKIYELLVNNYIITQNNDTRSILENIDLKIGLSPEVMIGFPGRSGEMTSGTDIFMRLNLFNL